MSVLPFDSFWSSCLEDRTSGDQGQTKVNAKLCWASFHKGGGWGGRAAEGLVYSKEPGTDGPHDFVLALPASKIYNV